MSETLVAADALEVPWGRILAVLGVTLLVTLAVGVGLRRILGLGPRARGGRASRLLALADALPLGQGRALYVVEAMGRRLVVAAAGDRVSLLADLGLAPAPEAPAALEAEAPEPLAPSPATGTPNPGDPAFDAVLEATRRFAAGRSAVA